MLKKMCKKCCHPKCTDTAQLILRLGVGIIFVFHGFVKLFGAGSIEQFSGMLAGLHFPIPTFFAYLVGAVEFFGGIAMLLGIFTDIAAILLAIIMAVAFVVVKSQKGWLPAGDVDIALLVASLAIFFGGPGKFSVIKKATNGVSCACSKDEKPVDKKIEDYTEKTEESASSEEQEKAE